MRLVPRLVTPVLAAAAMVGWTAADAPAAPVAHASIIDGTVATGAGPLALVANDVGQCSGSVIAANVVLTAAHCVHDPDTGALLDAGTFVVQTGAVRAADPAGSFTRVGQVVSYAWSPADSSGDLALLRLTTPTPAPPLSPATRADSALLAPGTAAVAEGWGVDTLGGDEPSEDLRSGGQVVQSPSFCTSQAQAVGARLDTSSTLCALDPRGITGVCNGDSGGPLIAARADGTPVEIGIVSFGAASCSPTRPGFYTRVDAFSSWIAGWVAALAPPPAPAPAAPAPAAPAAVPPPAAVTPAPAATPTPQAPSTGSATRYARYVGHGGYVAARVAADGAHVTWLRIGLSLTCRRSAHVYVNDIFQAPAQAGWPLTAARPLRLTLAKPATRRFLRRTDSIRLTPRAGGLDGSVTVTMRARAARLGTCAGAVRSFRLTPSR
ncbi:MAG TPA: serine protease [Baekduia sp.]|uniref:S1 family peptidase n=1 Tax=Baekduia sp. TaxID=2600305 RepID=UPI002D7799C8|nr:serine protease [Baekduia sp.]HET6508032.1 serine protease [Baekduia sp.]